VLEDELKAADLFSMAWTNPFKRFYDEGEAGAHAPPLRPGPLPLKGDVSLWSHIFFSWYRSCAFVDPILVFASIVALQILAKGFSNVGGLCTSCQPG
jgi:hypothetical protein